MSNEFGRFLTAGQVENMVIDTLRDWNPTYCREIERQLGKGVNWLPDLASIQVAKRVERWAEEALPAAIVVAPGLYDEPRRQGDGTYIARWSIGIAVICSARDRETTNFLSKIYSAMVRAVLVQKPALQGESLGVRWLDEKYDDLQDDDKSRTLAAGQAVFWAEFDDVVTAGSGPLAPSEDPGDWPTATVVHADAELEVLP